MDNNNFAIKITEENREIVKKWWLNRFPGHFRAWSTDAHYGVKETGTVYSF